MADAKNRISFDLSFLDRGPATTGTAHLAQTKYKYNWRNIGIVGAIVIGLIFWIASSDGSHNSTSASTQQYSAPSTFDPSTATPSIDGQSSLGNTPTGQFRCSAEESAAANQMKPTETNEAIDKAQEELEQRQSELKQLKSELDLAATNENLSQSEVDDYNAKVSEFNSKLDTLKSDEQAFDTRKSAFNSSVDAYNNYLQSHCGGR
jgi:hypothetical protein